MNLDDPMRVDRYNKAMKAGQKWASDELSYGATTVDLRDTMNEAIAAYIAVQTGRLPTIHLTSKAEHQEDLDLGEGFCVGASEILDESSTPGGAKLTEEQKRILKVWANVESRMPDKSLLMLAEFTANEAGVHSSDVFNALEARSQGAD